MLFLKYSGEHFARSNSEFKSSFLESENRNINHTRTLWVLIFCNFGQYWDLNVWFFSKMLLIKKNRFSPNRTIKWPFRESWVKILEINPKWLCQFVWQFDASILYRLNYWKIILIFFVRAKILLFISFGRFKPPNNRTRKYHLAYYEKEEMETLSDMLSSSFYCIRIKNRLLLVISCTKQLRLYLVLFHIIE